MGRLPPLLRALILLVACATPLMAAAEGDVYHLEISPFAGYRFGGSFDSDDTEDTGAGVDVDIDDHSSYGLIVNWPAEPNTEYEVFFSRQSTSLETDSLFAPGEPVLDELDITHLQLGGTYLFEGDRAWPFMVATIGASRFEPDNSAYDSETFFAFSIGGGYKIALTPRIGLRLEGRALASVVSSDSAVFCRSDEVSSGCLIAVRGSLVWQWETSAGLRVRF
jgi:hypothetical protein